MNTRTVLVLLAVLSLRCGWAAHAAESRPTLFATNRPERGWMQFHAAGYSEPVCGVVYRLKDSVTNGLALGGVDTGCLDLETNGTFGYTTIFNSIVPRGGSTLRTPVLALSVGGKTWASGGPLSKSRLTSTTDFVRACRPVALPRRPLGNCRLLRDLTCWRGMAGLVSCRRARNCASCSRKPCLLRPESQRGG